MDFVFDRTIEGRVLKCLTIVDDATHEAVAMVPERAISRLTVLLVLKVPFLTPFRIKDLADKCDSYSVNSTSYALVHI